MAGAAVGGGVGQTHALDAARIVGGKFLTLDGHGQFGAAVFLGEPFGAQTEIGPEAFALGGEFGGGAQGLGAAEFQFDAAGGFVADGPFFVQFHGGGDGGPEGDGVDAVFVAEEVGVGEGVQVVDAGVRAQGPGGFIFQTAGVLLILGLVFDGEVARIDGGDAPAGDGAAEAGAVGGEVGLAVTLALLVHGLAGNVGGAFELHLGHVARRQGAETVDDVHEHLGAVGRQAFAGDGVAGQHGLAGLGRGLEGFWVGDVGQPLGTAYGDGLEVLGGHDRAHAGAARGAVQIVDDGGVEVALFGSAAYGSDAHLRVLMRLFEVFFGMPAGGSPKIGGATQCGLVVFDVQIDGFGRTAFEDDHVPTGVFHFGTEEAAGVGAGDQPGERAFGDHGIASAGGGVGAGQGTGGHDEFVVRPQGIAGGIDFFVEVFGGQTALAEELVRPLHIEGFGSTGAFGEVDAQQFSRPRHDDVPL